jgi:hypothetical protein
VNWLVLSLGAAITVIARRNFRLLSLAGPVVLILTVLFWALLLWTGWVVLFSADAGSLANPQTREQADLLGRIYFTGYTMFTLGTEDFAPQGAFWQIASSITSLSGLFLLTLSVTYVLAVVEAVVGMRSFASQVWTLGHSAEAFVANAWNGRGFPAVEIHLVSLIEQLGAIGEQHKAYPMLHYYHAEKLPQSAFGQPCHPRRRAHDLGIPRARGRSAGARHAPQCAGRGARVFRRSARRGHRRVAQRAAVDRPRDAPRGGRARARP